MNNKKELNDVKFLSDWCIDILNLISENYSQNLSLSRRIQEIKNAAQNKDIKRLNDLYQEVLGTLSMEDELTKIKVKKG